MADAYVVNIGSEEWCITRTFGFYVIPARRLPFPYNWLKVKDRQEPIDIGDGKRIMFPVQAADIARDLVQDLDIHGVFVAAGAKPTNDELDRARQKMEDYYRKLVVDGDAKFAANRDLRTNGITDVHRRGALYLGEEREWAYIAERKVECPYCGARVRPGVAMCRGCNAILDPNKAYEGGLIDLEQYNRLLAARRKAPIVADEVAVEEQREHAGAVPGLDHSDEANAGDEQLL